MGAVFLNKWWNKPGHKTSLRLHLAWPGLVRQFTLCDLKLEFSQLWLLLGDVFREQVSASLNVLLWIHSRAPWEEIAIFLSFSCKSIPKPGMNLSQVFIPEWMFVCKCNFIRGWNYFIIKVYQSLAQPWVEGGVQCCLRSSSTGGVWGSNWAFLSSLRTGFSMTLITGRYFIPVILMGSHRGQDWEWVRISPLNLQEGSVCGGRGQITASWRSTLKKRDFCCVFNPFSQNWGVQN